MNRKQKVAVVVGAAVITWFTACGESGSPAGTGHRARGEASVEEADVLEAEIRALSMKISRTLDLVDQELRSDPNSHTLRMFKLATAAEEARDTAWRYLESLRGELARGDEARASARRKKVLKFLGQARHHLDEAGAALDR